MAGALASAARSLVALVFRSPMYLRLAGASALSCSGVVRTTSGGWTLSSTTTAGTGSRLIISGKIFTVCSGWKTSGTAFLHSISERIASMLTHARSSPFNSTETQSATAQRRASSPFGRATAVATGTYCLISPPVQRFDWLRAIGQPAKKSGNHPRSEAKDMAENIDTGSRCRPAQPSQQHHAR